jgi:hypothetical protein
VGSSLTITTKTSDGRKGRTFTGVVLSVSFASGLWEGGKSKGASRPIMLTIACSPGAAKPLRENLRAGEAAELRGGNYREAIECPKTLGYFFPPLYPCGGAEIVTVVLPELFEMRRGSEDDGVRFVMMPALTDIDALVAGRNEEVEAAIAHVRLAFHPRDLNGWSLGPELIGEAAYFAHVLNQRCELPRYPGLAFATQLFVASVLDVPDPFWSRAQPVDPAKQHGAEARRIGLRAHVAPGVAMLPGIGFSASKMLIETFMAAQVRVYDDVRRGVPTRRREAEPVRRIGRPAPRTSGA